MVLIYGYSPYWLILNYDYKSWKMKSYNIYWFNRTEEEEILGEDAEEDFIDWTNIDELSEDLVWDLFKEFGHTRTKKTYYTYEEEED